MSDREEVNNQYNSGYKAEGKLNLANPPKVGTGITPKSNQPSDKEK